MIIHEVRITCDYPNCNEVVSDVGPLSFSAVMRAPKLPKGWTVLTNGSGSQAFCCAHDVKVGISYQEKVNDPSLPTL